MPASWHRIVRGSSLGRWTGRQPVPMGGERRPPADQEVQDQAQLAGLLFALALVLIIVQNLWIVAAVVTLARPAA